MKKIFNKRYLHMLRLLFIPSPVKRANYMRKKKLFRSCGEKVMITSRKIPLYSRLISIGNNVWIAAGVEFVTHDVIHFMLNVRRSSNEKRFEENVGCIDIGNNVFIGSGVKILYNVKIGSNVIVAAGSLVNRDIPDNVVVGGIPAKIIGNFDQFVEKRRQLHFDYNVNNNAQEVSQEAEDLLWDKFWNSRQ